VTACQALIDEAVKRNAQALLVHHGILWGNQMPVITRSFRRRIQSLLDANINLLAYHLPLDRHLDVGNGAMVAKRLGLTNLQPFGAHKNITVGVRADAESPMTIDGLTQRVREVLSSDPTVFAHGAESIRTIGIVTGAADKDLPQAVEAGLDCYITGEISEYVMHYAREEGIHFIAAGHHATERWGVQALAEHVANEHGLTWEFVDVPNPA
jgi:dinuclear metal center YbgI/SA1388 family protein